MKRLLAWSVALGWGLLGCSVPSLEELEAERTVAVKVSFNFKAGCISVTVRDRAKPTVNFANSAVDVWERAPTNRVATVAVFRNDEWGRTIDVIATAHERDCTGPVVAQAQAEVALDTAGKKEVSVALGAIDGDGDGYVPTTANGTDCDDTLAAVNPGASEVCDDRDNNCNGSADEGVTTQYYRDVDGDGAGAGPSVSGCAPPAGYVAEAGDCDDNDNSIAPNKQELCDNKDNNCSGGVDEGFDKNWYRDGDGDGFGLNTPPTVQCDQPMGFVQVRDGRFDCDDGERQVNPDAMETCNNRDDNCAGGVDEGFTEGPQAKGATCNVDICVGTYQCNAAGNGTECSATAPADYYPDVDGDMQGNASASAARICSYQTPPVNHVRANREDCDDADPRTRQGGTEVCDALDNDCDGQVDEELNCGGQLRRVIDGALGNAASDYRAVAVDPTDGYPVWVAGMEGVMVVKRTASDGFDRFTTNPDLIVTPCGTTDWYAAWVRPGTNTVFLAGEGGALAEHTGGTSCGRTAIIPGMSAGEYLTGLVGFIGGSPPSVTLYAVSSHGGLFEWRVGTSAPTRVRDGGDSYWDLSALDTNRLLVVGDNRGPPAQPRVFPFVPPYTSAPEDQTLETPAGYEGSLRGVAMSSASLAYAVGDNGLALRWTGGANWVRVAPPAAVGTAPFTSVATPGAGSNIAYVVDKNEQGKLYRLTEYGFAVAPSFINTDGQPDNPDRPLYDIAMTSVGNVWMVGDDGRVYHFPQ